MPLVPLADASPAKRSSSTFCERLGGGCRHCAPFVTDVSLRMPDGGLATCGTGNSAKLNLHRDYDSLNAGQGATMYLALITHMVNYIV